MPFMRRILSQAEGTEHLRRAEQLRASGVEIDIPKEWVENSRALDIVLAGPAENIVFETPNGGFVYAVLARWVAVRSGLIVVDWNLNTDYDDQIVPCSDSDRGTVYRLGRHEYRRCEVLNERIEAGLRL